MPDTEPAMQVALASAIAKAVVAICAAGGLALSDNTTGVIVSLAGGVIAILLSVLQGKITRGKVFSPATVEAIAPGSTGEPVLSVPINR